MKLRTLLMLTLLGLSFVACGSNDDPPIVIPVDPDTPSENNNDELKSVIANANFEEDVDLTKYTGELQPGKWYYVGGWCDYAAKVSLQKNRGYKDSQCLCIIATDHTVDVGVAQRIKVTPGKLYKVSARIKTNGVSGANSESGAHISLNEVYGIKSKRVYGTSEWTSVSLEIEPDTEYIEIALKLGANCDDAKGEAFFDNVTITYNTSLYTQESEHFNLIAEKSLISISQQNIDSWLKKLDKVYDSYVELFSGRKPFGGRKTKIRAADIPAWAYAGNPIQWNSKYIVETLNNTLKGDWCFGLMHEIGHNFAPGNFEEFKATYAFDFNEEVFANWRMYYALEKNDAVVLNNGKTYVGKEIVALYKSDTDNCYDKVLAARRPVEMGNALTYCLWRIKEKYGWQLWIDTWDDIYKIPRNESRENQMTQWQKFEYLLNKLNEHVPAGEDVRSTFPEGELDIIKEYLSTQR